LFVTVQQYLKTLFDFLGDKQGIKKLFSFTKIAKLASLKSSLLKMSLLMAPIRSLLLPVIGSS
jgi:hypothetical protein